MHVQSGAETKTEFFALATRLKMISAELAQAASIESTESGTPPAQFVTEQGLLDAPDVDIIESLLHPSDVVPGYELMDLLGRGGMGVVYRARQKNLDRMVAMKTVLLNRMSDPCDVARFEQEAIAVARLKHPNIVTAYDFGRHRGRLYFVMELVEGESLEQLLEQRGRPDETTAWGLVRQAAAGLAHAVAAEIVHRDVKPANLLLVSAPEGSPLPAGMPMVKLADLGVALLKGGSESDTRITMTGATVGSPYYMAPEQLDGSDVDHRADIYALGITAFRTLAGTAPFDGRTVAQVIAQKLSGQLASLRDVAPDISQESEMLVAAMMERDRSRRIQDYRTLFERIDHLPAVSRPVASAAVQFQQSAPVHGAASTVEFAFDRTAASEPAADVATQRIAARMPWRRRLAYGLVFLLLGLSVMAWICFSPWRGRSSASAVVGDVNMVPSGWGQALYDGSTLTVWSPIRGEWSHGRDAEGGKVLSGRGGVSRQLPQYAGSDDRPLRNFRISMLVDLQQAAAMELQFGLGSDPRSGMPRNVLRVARDGVVLGRRGQDQGKLTPLSDLIPFPKPDASAAANYHELCIERRANHWWVYFDDQVVGRAASDPDGELHEIRLFTEEGAALFDSIEIVELVEYKQPNVAKETP